MGPAIRLARQNWKLLSSLGLFAGLILAVEGACWWGSPEAGSAYEYPSQKHWLGTVAWGGDMAHYVRTALARSLLIASLITIFTMTTGYLIGGVWAISSRYGVRSITIRGIVVGLIGPTPIVLMLAILPIFPEPAAAYSIILTMSLISWPLVAIRIQNELRQMLDTPYIRLAREEGAGELELLLVELLPLMLPVLEKVALLSFVFGIEAEAMLGYLGIGSTSPSLGRLLNESVDAFQYGEPRFIHGIRYIVIVAGCLASAIGSLKLFIDWRDDCRIRRTVRVTDLESARDERRGWLVSVSHRSSGVHLLNKVTIPYLPGQIMVLAGASGSGKTLAVRAIANLLPPTLTAHCMKSEGLPQPNEIVVVPQGAQEHFSESFSIGKYIEFSQIPVKHIEQSLDSVGLSIADLKTTSGEWKTGQTLSGGMSQRLAVALAIHRNAKVLIFDEPIAALDTEGIREFGELLRRLLTTRKDLAILVVNHRPGWTRQFADQVVFINSGTSVWIGSNAEFWRDGLLTPDDISHPAVKRYQEAAHHLSTEWTHDHLRQGRVETQSTMVRTINWLPSFETGIEPVTLTVRKGETLAIVAGNGLGKTTLLRTIAGKLSPKSGVILVGPVAFESDSSAYAKPQRHCHPNTLVRMCHQNPVLSLNPHLRVEAILLNTIRRLGISGRAASQPIIVAACAKAHFPMASLSKTPAELSGGLRARAALARALLGEVEVLLLDEPTAGLDPEVALDVLDSIRHLASSGIAIIGVFHDSEHTGYLGPSILRLQMKT